MRRLVRQARLSVDDLVWPLFVTEGATTEDITSMPGVRRHPLTGLAAEARAAADLGIPMIALFPHVAGEKKDDMGSEALNPDNLVCRAVGAVKAAAPEVGVMCDVALDPFTSHGHDGLVEDGIVVNDATVEVLCRQAVVQAGAGCDVIAPSDMMDGRVGAIRSALDGAGFTDVAILSYAAKYVSAFYGPFRDAVGSASLLTDEKKTYQMDPANGNEALREVALDIAEGADMVMVKPGLPCLDVVARVKERFGVPVLAYQVSGEYAMMAAAAERGWLDRERAIVESLTAFRRAGADAVVTYFALEAARLLREE
jgi:porphobilinogen synthase